MYPFMTLDDNTEIVHSEMHEDGSVVVCCERPIRADFKTAYCKIPGYVWYDVENYSTDELNELTRVLKTVDIVAKLGRRNCLRSALAG